MMWVLIIVGVVAFFAWAFFNNSIEEWGNEYDMQQKEKYKKQGKEYIDSYCRIKYVCGFKDISRSIVSLELLGDEIIIEFEDKNTTRIIKKQDIKDIYLNTETEIQNNISVGKILAFGALSLGMDNSKTEIHDYIVIECNYGGDDLTLVFTKFIGSYDDKVQLMRKLYLGK